MVIPKDLKERARMTREDGVFTLKLDEGISLAMLVSFAQDMFPGVNTEDIGVWPADDGELGSRYAVAEQLQRIERPPSPSALPRRQCQKSEGHPTRRNVVRIPGVAAEFDDPFQPSLRRARCDAAIT